MRRKELREKRSELSLQGLVLCTCLHPAVVYFVEMDDNRILKWGKETLWYLLTTAENSDNCGRTTSRGNDCVAFDKQHKLSTSLHFCIHPSSVTSCLFLHGVMGSAGYCPSRHQARGWTGRQSVTDVLFLCF